MNQPNFVQPAKVTLFQILGNELAEVLRSKRVQIQFARDRERDGVFVGLAGSRRRRSHGTGGCFFSTSDGAGVGSAAAAGAGGTSSTAVAGAA